jgi:hypothetical protein
VKFPDAEPEQQSNGQSQVGDSVLLDSTDKIEAEAADSNGSAVENADSFNQESNPEMQKLDGVAAESVFAINDRTPENCEDNQKAVLLNFETAENSELTSFPEMMPSQEFECPCSDTGISQLFSHLMRAIKERTFLSDQSAPKLPIPIVTLRLPQRLEMFARIRPPRIPKDSFPN